uniref:Granulins domain-containing protein n=1 Tax=Mola mola TaxID=94237 RepID=A0A3Q4BWN0_MOLML
MLRLPLCLLVGVCVWGFVSCSITCPDGNVCSDFATCCITLHGYSCCPYPKAVCCSDLAHCCPSGFVCNLDTQQCERPSQPWLNIPMVKKEKAEELIAPVQPVSSPQELKKSYVPDKQKSSVVFCDNYYTCPDGNTCCRHRQGVLLQIPLCNWTHDCDDVYVSLEHRLGETMMEARVQESLCAYLFQTPRTALSKTSGSMSEAEVIRCDSKFYCSKGTSCCKGPQGQWNCCPYRLGQCCSDGQHCCEYGYTCTTTSLSCHKPFSQVPSATQERAKSD